MSTHRSRLYDLASVEVRGLRLGLRTAWRLRADASQLHDFIQDARSDGWSVAHSPQPLAMAVGGHLGRPDQQADSAYLVVIAQDLDLATQCLTNELALLTGADSVAQMVARHRQLGLAYGFPSCCVEAFADAFVEVVHGAPWGDNALAIARAARRSRSFDPLLCTLVGTLGDTTGSPLRHLPCRFDCPASQVLAQTLLNDQAVLRGLAPAALYPAPRPAVVGRDGSFALLSATWQPDSHVIAGICGVHAQGFAVDPARQPPWQRVLTANPPSALRICDGTLQAPTGPTWRAVQPVVDGFPLILPFC